MSHRTDRGKNWVVEPTEEMEIKREVLNGKGSEEPLTIISNMKKIVDLYGDAPALRVKREGKWREYNYKVYYQAVQSCAASLIHLGFKERDIVLIMGFNSPEWFVADLGAIFAGGIAAGVYTTNQAEACHYVADHSKAKFVFVENEVHLEKFLALREQDRVPEVKKVIVWAPTKPIEDGENDFVWSWRKFVDFGEELLKEEKMVAALKEREANTKPGHCSTLIYTSGTTGNPKAVMISHDNVVWTSQVVGEVLGFTPRTEHICSYLPLSHIAAQMVDIHAPLLVGGCVWFADPMDMKKGTLVNTLKEVRPTVFLGVPRVWEKIEEKMKKVGAETKGAKKVIATWAKQKGLTASYNIQKGKAVPWFTGLYKKVVYDKVRANLGLDRCRLMATAAAPIARSTLDYFLSLMLPVYEIYGMSECTGPQTVNHPGKHRTGTVGPSIPGTELELGKDDNEICYRGRHIMMGYMYNEQATISTIDERGFLHSGDVGSLDEQGYLSITGRIKEILITAGGENIPCPRIETCVKDHLDALARGLVANVMLIGDRQKFLTMVFTLKCKENDPTLLDGTPAVAPDLTTVEAARKNEKVREVIDQAIQRYNKNDAISQAQRIGKFDILPEDFSIENNCLTPTMKLKRKIVMERFKDIIEALYN